MTSTSTTNEATAKPCQYCHLSYAAPIPLAHQALLERDKHIYFRDGNVILVAGPTYFRVHQSILAKHSPVFSDLFSIPQSPEQELYEGVPRVDLQDDPVSIRAFLQLIYEPFSNQLKTWLNQPTAQSTSEMVGVFSLALKYQVDTLRDEIIQQLLSVWPRTLEQWDLLEKRRQMIGDTTCIEPGLTIRIARVANMPEILPVAYYCFIQSYPKRGSMKETESKQNSTEENYRSPKSNSLMTLSPPSHVTVDLLDRADLTAVSLGREEMTKWISRRCRASFRTWSCPSSMSQRGVVCCQRIHLRWAELLEDVTMRRDVLQVLKEHVEWGAGTFGMILCSVCQGQFVEIVKNMREEFWTALPGMFGLPEGDLACHLACRGRS